jgi:hypothetical protein
MFVERPKGQGIQTFLEDEFLGKMVPYATAPGPFRSREGSHREQRYGSSLHD